MNRLHPRIQAIWVLRAIILSSLLGAAVGGATFFLGLPWWLAPLVFGGMLLITIPLAVARYRRWGYEIREDALYLERGVITQVRTVVPFVRIQHVDSRRSPVERAIGLASTVVYTAGSRGADVRVPGLTHEGAQSLQERLKRKAILTEAEDAV